LPGAVVAPQHERERDARTDAECEQRRGAKRAARPPPASFGRRDRGVRVRERARRRQVFVDGFDPTWLVGVTMGLCFVAMWHDARNRYRRTGLATIAPSVFARLHCGSGGGGEG